MNWALWIGDFFFGEDPEKRQGRINITIAFFFVLSGALLFVMHLRMREMDTRIEDLEKWKTERIAYMKIQGEQYEARMKVWDKAVRSSGLRDSLEIARLKR